MEKFQYCFCLEKHFYKIYKTYNHEFGNEFPQNIYSYDLYYNLATDEMFSKFPYFFVTISTLCIMQGKNDRFIMTIHCDYLES